MWGWQTFSSIFPLTATTSDNDYIAKSGTLTFKREANETFYLDLFNSSSNSLFTKNRGLGMILNDD